MAIGMFIFMAITGSAQKADRKSTFDSANSYEIIRIESHIPNLKIALTHKPPGVLSNDYPVLMLHGASFPSTLAFGFRMGNYSWMDNLAENGYDVYALDLLGYGNSDRYPEMDVPAAASTRTAESTPVGRAVDVYKDVDKAVDLIIRRTGQQKVYLVGHSWGGTVAALYAERFPEKVSKLVLFSAITPRRDSSDLEATSGAYDTVTPAKRVAEFKALTPAGETCSLEPEVFTSWGDSWLRSDKLALKYHSNSVRFPSGAAWDENDLLLDKPYYDPAAIQVPVLLIRGEWDQYPNSQDYEGLFAKLKNAPYKKYVVLEKGTHVIHLEKNRYELYDETLHFLRWGANTQVTNRHPIAVIFEVIPAAGHKDEYLDLALRLKPELEKIKGFISIERFQSIYHPEKILSLSIWENEAAIAQWRNLESHRAAQAKGRAYIFKDYHLRIAQVIRDYGMFNREEAPLDSKTYHR